MTHSFTFTDLRLPALIITLIVALLLYASISSQPTDPSGWNAPRLNSQTATPTQANTGWWQDFPTPVSLPQYGGDTGASPISMLTSTPTSTTKGSP